LHRKQQASLSSDTSILQSPDTSVVTLTLITRNVSVRLSATADCLLCLVAQVGSDVQASPSPHLEALVSLLPAISQGIFFSWTPSRYRHHHKQKLGKMSLTRVASVETFERRRDSTASIHQTMTFNPMSSPRQPSKDRQPSVVTPALQSIEVSKQKRLRKSRHLVFTMLSQILTSHT
jgi:hypothetical protein